MVSATAGVLRDPMQNSQTTKFQADEPGRNPCNLIVQLNVCHESSELLYAVLRITVYPLVSAQANITSTTNIFQHISRSRSLIKRLLFVTRGSQMGRRT